MKTTIPQDSRTQAAVVGDVMVIFDVAGDLWLHVHGPSSDEIASIRISGEDVEKLAKVLSAVVEDHRAWFEKEDSAGGDP
jgi:hypothetical protein